MRILIIATFFPPQNSIASLRPYSWAKYWSLAGHDVTVLTTTKSPTSTDLSMSSEGFKVLEVPSRGFMTRFKITYQKNNASISNSTSFLSLLKRSIQKKFFFLFDRFRQRTGSFSSCRMPDFTDLWIAPALKKIKEEGQWDLAISTAGPYSVHLIGASLKKNQYVKRWIADYRDPWSDNYIYKGIFPLNCFEAILEKKILNRADLITTVSSPFAKTYASKYPCTPVLTVENGFDPNDLEELPSENIFPKDGKFRIVHTGSIYHGKRNPLPLFKAIKAVAEDPIYRDLLHKLEVIFVGAHQANLQTLIAKFGVKKWVKVQELVSRTDALRMQRDAHYLLFLPWNDPSIDGILTGKIFEYLYSKTPILSVGAEQLEASQKLILEAKAGIALHSPIEIQDFLTAQLRDPQKKQMALEEKLLNQYNRKTLAMKILNHFST